MPGSKVARCVQAVGLPHDDVEQIQAVQSRGNKPSLPEEAEVSLATMIRLCSRWSLGLRSTEVKECPRLRGSQ